MIFSTIERYNEELKDMQQELDETNEYLKKHPEKHGTKGNYETLKYLYGLFSEDRINFIKDTNDFNLRLLDKNEASMPLIRFNNLSNKFNDITNFTIGILENNNNYKEELNVKSISKGSYKITFEFPNPTEDDVLRKSPRKRGLMKIFDFINCGDDLEKLKKEAGPDGQEALIAYKKFLEEIVKNEADFTLDTEMGTVKAGLSLEECRNICENLKL